MKTVAVLTEDEYLFRKIALELGDVPTVRKPEGASLVLFDRDTSPEDAPEGAVSLSRFGGADLPIPFPIGTICRLLDRAEESAPLLLGQDGRSAFLFGKEIRLTEVEFSLLRELYAAEGFTSREQLLKAVWQGEADGGVLNVYIHYLREKLETNGEKVILSSRGSGYALDEKYRGKRGGNGHA